MTNLLYFGDAVKALDENGRVGGYLVRFTNSDHKDLVGDYFTKDTYLGPKYGDGNECLFDHGFSVGDGVDLPAEIKRTFEELASHTFAPIKTKKDAIGIWAETVLDIADEYEKAVFGVVKRGKIGWSSGAPGHRVKRDQDGRITSWPIAEGSLTPRPAEPLNRAIDLKSLAAVKFVTLADDTSTTDQQMLPIKLAAKLNQLIDDRVDDGISREGIVKWLANEAAIEVSDVNAIVSGKVPRPADPYLRAFARVLKVDFEALRESAHGISPQTIKGMFEDVLADRTPSRWELDSAFCDVIRKLANVAASTTLTGVDFNLEEKVDEAIGEYMKRLKALVLAQVAEYVDSGADEPFYLKAIINLSDDLPVSGNLDLDEHSQLVVSALREVAKRFRANHSSRVKSGRVLSEKNRQRIVERLKDIQSVTEDLTALLEESQPMASDEEKSVVYSTFLRLQKGAKRLGVA